MTKIMKKEIIAKNPHVNAKKLNQVLQIIRKRRANGLNSARYTLDIPFTNRIHAKQERDGR